MRSAVPYQIPTTTGKCSEREQRSNATKAIANSTLIARSIRTSAALDTDC